MKPGSFVDFYFGELIALWRDVVAHREQAFIDDFDVFRDFLAVIVWELLEIGNRLGKTPHIVARGGQTRADELLG